MMDFEFLIQRIYDQQDDTYLNFAKPSEKIMAMYILYHYFNADVSRLDEVNNSLTTTIDDSSFKIRSVLKSVNIDDAIDFNSYLKKEDFDTLQDDELIARVKELARVVGATVYHDKSISNFQLIDKFDELQVKLTESTSYVVRILCPFNVDIDKKIHVQEIISDISVSGGNVLFEIIFGDDLEQEISDIDSPKEYVASGTLNLVEDSICYFGQEESFVTIVSAKSLKQIFLQYSTRGLFASNLRFYITNKKIDGKIKNTIQNEPENFCYFNNGIIITCDKYDIVDRKIRLTNFSIVNGGQTTNIIGRTPFEKDFGIICKVIQNKYEDQNERIQFLSKVAEASNMQKPINSKDLIANKPEQRLLKIQFAEAGMFLKVKRGEKIDKSVYHEPYMNASNDEVAQLLYSYVYQAPGAAKNSKSSLLSNDKTYNLIFKNNYNSEFLKSLQILKVAYSDWQKKLNKTEPHSSSKYGLSRHANFMVGALIGFYQKIAINENVRNTVAGYKFSDIGSKNVDLKNTLKVNDIGLFSLIKPEIYSQITKTTFYTLFEYLFDNILLPAYQKFKRLYPNYAFSNFCRTDSYYYDFVLPYAKHFISNPKTANELMSLLNVFNSEASVDIVPTNEPDDYSCDGLEDELKSYRSRVADESDRTVKSSDVLKNLQIASIVRFFPKTANDLYEQCNLTDEQIAKYGQDILEIVKKYIRTKDFE